MSKGGRITVMVMLGLLVLGIVGGGGYVIVDKASSLFSSAPDYDGNGSAYGTVVIQVNTGDTATDIAGTLKAKGVVKSVQAFVDAARGDDRSRGITPGYYRLHVHQSAATALRALLDPASRVESTVTIPEGFTVEQIVARTAQKTHLDAATLKAALQPPASALGLPGYAKGRAEGFLFPATYSFGPDVTAPQALAQMVARFTHEADQLDLQQQAAALGRSPYDVVTIASLVEREARLPEDFPKVARVIYNRLELGMPLQLDSTVNYALHQNKTNVTIEDTKVSSPYNTYLHKGLPPTPIASPGTRALQAALKPAKGDWLYFVTMDDAGHNAFTSNYDEFLRLKATAERQRSK